MREEWGVGTGGAEQRKEADEHIRERLLCQREKKDKKKKRESSLFSTFSLSFNLSLSQVSNKAEQWAEVLIGLPECDFNC